MFVVVESKANKLNSIYALEYDRKKCCLMSGRNIFLNIEHRILNILPTAIIDTFLIETEGKLLKWNLSAKEAKF